MAGEQKLGEGFRKLPLGGKADIALRRDRRDETRPFRGTASPSSSPLATASAASSRPDASRRKLLPPERLRLNRHPSRAWASRLRATLNSNVRFRGSPDTSRRPIPLVSDAIGPLQTKVLSGESRRAGPSRWLAALCSRRPS